MKCPVCGKPDTAVKDSRLAEDQTVIKRRRMCDDCGFRFTTFERAQLKEVWVVKKNGQKEPFDREKIVKSIKIAIHKSDVTHEKIELIVSEITRQLELADDVTISTRVLGGMVLKALAGVDPVAYVRFASIYEKFENIEDFANIIKSNLLKAK
jgi:transcriptional repressor NrdR